MVSRLFLESSVWSGRVTLISKNLPWKIWSKYYSAYEKWLKEFMIKGSEPWKWNILKTAHVILQIFFRKCKTALPKCAQHANSEYLSYILTFCRPYVVRHKTILASYLFSTVWGFKPYFFWKLITATFHWPHDDPCDPPQFPPRTPRLLVLNVSKFL